MILQTPYTRFSSPCLMQNPYAGYRYVMLYCVNFLLGKWQAKQDKSKEAV